MKKEVISISLIVGMVFACLALARKEGKEQYPSNSKGFAVVELFSSEGCSSCPPAEAVMHKLIGKANAECLPVYVIEFHVDYWDYLGWKDTFAMAEYSQKQQDYGDFFRLSSIYTPQAIINGKTEMVGSDEEKVNSTIAQEVHKPAAINIDCKATHIADSKIEVNYTITGNISGCELNIALVESGLMTHIRKGENANRTIAHDNVARVFKSIKLNSLNGEITLDAPHVNLSHARLICYIQNTENKSIMGATQVGNIQ